MSVLTSSQMCLGRPSPQAAEPLPAARHGLAEYAGKHHAADLRRVVGRVAHPIVRIVREPVRTGEIPERRDARNLIKRLREILRQVAALDRTMERTDGHDK